VTATSRHLDRLRGDAETYEFRELFHGHTRLLRPLSLEDLRQVVAEHAAERGMPVEADLVELAARLSGGHPGLLGHVCRRVADGESVRPWPLGAAAWLEDPAIESECWRLWAELEELEREALLVLVADGESALAAGPRASLAAKGLVLEQAGERLRVFSPLFQAYVQGLCPGHEESPPTGVRCDLTTGQIWVDGRERTGELSQRQRALLRCLYQRGSGVCTFDEIRDAVWQTPVGVTPGMIYELVKRVRIKIEADWKQPRYLISVSGEGYRLACEPG
jgi:hypothetical protein